MRIRYRRLVVILLIVFITGCVCLLNSAFRDLNLQLRNLRGNKFYNYRDVSEGNFNTSSDPGSVTAGAWIVPTTEDVAVVNHVATAVPIRAHGGCPSVIMLPKLVSKDSWQSVDENLQVYVFSAYLEGQTVRLIGAKTTSIPQLLCQFYYRLNQTDASMETTAAQARTIPEGHGRKYTASHFLCDLPGSLKPYAVSLVDQKCRDPANVVYINIFNSGPKRNFTVCAPPLHFYYNRANELIEWIELNRILGVNFFTLYNHTTGPEVNTVLNYYAKQGILEVIPWDLPMGVDTWPRKKNPVEIHYFGQLAASNDCLRRNRNLTTNLLIIDLDEFIIPRAKDVQTLTEMMKSLPDRGAYVFCNTFFREDWEDTDRQFENKDLAIRFRLNTLLKLNRESKISPHNSRSKYIVKPNEAEVLGIHQTWALGPQKEKHNVPKEVALVHHYRSWENPLDKRGQVEDKLVLDKYRARLIDRVSQVWKRLNLHNLVKIGPK